MVFKLGVKKSPTTATNPCAGRSQSMLKTQNYDSSRDVEVQLVSSMESNRHHKAFSRPQQLLKKVVKQGKALTTPAPRNGGSFTPATTLVGPDLQTTDKQTYNSNNNDNYVPASVLEERERIRQQLFCDETCVEVSANFPPSPKKQQRKQEKQPASNETGLTSKIGESNCPTPEAKTRKEIPLPPTPELDETELDPVPRFPAVAAAVAAKNERRPTMNASHITSETSPTSLDDQFASSSALPKDTLMNQTSANALSMATPSFGGVSSNKITPILRDASSNKTTSNYGFSSDGITLNVAGISKKATVTPSFVGKSSNKTEVLPSFEGISSAVTPLSPSPEKPFDEARKIETVLSEDPTITEIEMENNSAFPDDEITAPVNNNKSKNHDISHQSSHATASGIGGADCAGLTPITTDKEEDVTRKLLDVFNCGDDFTEFSGSAMVHQSHRSCRLVDAFYDNSCWTYREAVSQKRPYYDESFAQRFLKDITDEGVNVLWHLPPSDEESAKDDSNWSGQSVLMKIKPGTCYEDYDNQQGIHPKVQPKLVWTTLGGGNNPKVVRCSISLLAIQSISTFNDSIAEGEEFVEDNSNDPLTPLSEEEDVCLFAITTEEGDVQVFEAASARERDLLVAGIKNVIARLTFHLVVGDAGASSELYYEEDKNPPSGESPSFTSPLKNMNRLSHALMD